MKVAWKTSNINGTLPHGGRTFSGMGSICHSAPRSSGCSRSTKLSCVAEAKVKTSAKMLPKMQRRRSAAVNVSSPFGLLQLLIGLGPLWLAQQALEKVEQGGEIMIASNFPCFICSKSFSRSLLRERSIQGFRLISMQGISRLRPSVAQSCFKQLCMSQRLGVPEKRYRTRKDFLAATGTVGGGGVGCLSGVLGQAFAPCVSAVLLAAAVH